MTKVSPHILQHKLARSRYEEVLEDHLVDVVTSSNLYFVNEHWFNLWNRKVLSKISIGQIGSKQFNRLADTFIDVFR